MLEINPNQSPVDVYTLFHGGVGVISKQVGLTFGQTIALSLAWEWVIEPMYKDRYPGIFPAPSQDSVVNRVVDTVAVAVGWSMS
jgi:hypothetical protein